MKKAGIQISYHVGQPILVIDRYGLIELTEVWTKIKPYLWEQ